tara:strand:- start:222 stop:1070 length:849 start_codon:yes stop_codon:yes gene_type:complete
MTKRKAKAKRKVNSRKKVTAKAKAVSNVKKAKAKAVKSKAKKQYKAKTKSIAIRAVKIDGGLGLKQVPPLKTISDLEKVARHVEECKISGQRDMEYANKGGEGIRTFVQRVAEKCLVKFPTNKNGRADFNHKEQYANLHICTCEFLSIMQPVLEKLRKEKKCPDALKQAVSDFKANMEMKGKTQKQKLANNALSKNAMKEVITANNNTVKGKEINPKKAGKSLSLTCGQCVTEHNKKFGFNSYAKSEYAEEVQEILKETEVRVKVVLAKIKKAKIKKVPKVA